MIVMGMESSCDECSIALVEDGKNILSNVVATQIEDHKPYNGVVPEIASRLHTEWIRDVYRKSLREAGLTQKDIDGIAVTAGPGLVGSLLVSVNFAKALAYGLNIPFVGVDHILAHLYAPRLEADIPYPHLGVIVSGGHTVIGKVDDFDQVDVLGTTIDDAVGEAFDKVAKFFDWGYPGGVVIDRMAEKGNDKAYAFPKPNLYKGNHPFDISYSGLKTAVVNQLGQFHQEGFPEGPEDIAASFRRTAVEMLLDRIKKALKHTGLETIVAGGGVSANALLRKRLKDLQGVNSFFPSPGLCTDNGAMIAGLGFHYLKRGDRAALNLNATPRTPAFRRKSYP